MKKSKRKTVECWESYRRDAKARERLDFRFGRAAQPGVFTAEVYHEDLPAPLAVVWFSYSGLNCIQILNSFVFEHVRRCGLRTLLHEKMLEFIDRDVVVSPAGTTSGAAWMKAIGYTKGKNGWEFRRKQLAGKR